MKYVTQPCLLLLLLKKNITVVLSSTLHLLSFTSNTSLDIGWMNILGFQHPKKIFQRDLLTCQFNKQMTKMASSSVTLGSRVYLEWVWHVNAIFHCSYLMQLSENIHLFFKGHRIRWPMVTPTLFPETQDSLFNAKLLNKNYAALWTSQRVSKH